MSELQTLSFNFAEISALKREVSGGRRYSDRLSFALTVRLLEMREKFGEDQLVLLELDQLEGLRAKSATKSAAQFRPPLHPFWHKHFSGPRHILPNIGSRWGLTGQGNRDLDALIRRVANDLGNDPARWPRALIHQLVYGGFSDRRQTHRLTGDWIIFAKHEGCNYYLDLATHQEGRNADQLQAKLRQGCAVELPFLFP